MKNKMPHNPDHREQVINVWPLNCGTWRIFTVGFRLANGTTTIPGRMHKQFGLEPPSCSLKDLYGLNSLVLLWNWRMLYAAGSNNFICEEFQASVWAVTISSYYKSKLKVFPNAIQYSHLFFFPSNHSKHYPILCHWSQTLKTIIHLISMTNTILDGASTSSDSIKHPIQKLDMQYYRWKKYHHFYSIFFVPIKRPFCSPRS